MTRWLKGENDVTVTWFRLNQSCQDPF